jgi:hypothetical protein
MIVPVAIPSVVSRASCHEARLWMKGIFGVRINDQRLGPERFYEPAHIENSQHGSKKNRKTVLE